MISFFYDLSRIKIEEVLFSFTEEVRSDVRVEEVVAVLSFRLFEAQVRSDVRVEEVMTALFFVRSLSWAFNYSLCL